MSKGAGRQNRSGCVVVDDQELFRRGLTMLLGVEPDIEVVGEAGDGITAADPGRQRVPDVVLLDVRMPKRSGLEACIEIKELVPARKIIMLTVSDEEADLYEAVKNGASGYLLKDSSIDEVAQAVRVVAEGQSLISPSMAVKLIDEFKEMSRTDREQVPTPRLTDRELEVLRLVATRPEQPRGRQAAVHQREHGEEPRPQHPGEAAAPLPDGGGHVRRPREVVGSALIRAGPRLSPPASRVGPWNR